MALPFAEAVQGAFAALAGTDPEVAGELLSAAACIAESGGLDEDALRQAGLGARPAAGASVLIVRCLPYGLLSPADRPRLRRGAYRCAGLGGGDSGTAITAVAGAVLAADLARGFDIGACVVRCRQTLLEEAPLALLEHLGPLAADAELGDDADPTVALQLAVTALDRCQTAGEAVALLGERRIAAVIAAFLGGIRSGGVAGDERAAAAATALLAAATAPAAS